MSSSSKTANLQLNQWQRSDGICMDDFNADNVKIDTAVKAAQDSADETAQAAAIALAAAVAAVPVRRLMEVTTTQDATQVDIDVSSIDFTQYAEIKIVPFMIDPSLLTSNLFICLRVNDIATGYKSNILDSQGSNSASYNLLTYWCMNKADDTVGRAAYNSLFGTTQNGFVACARHCCYYETASACKQDPLMSFIPTVRWSELTKLNFYVSSGTIPAGTQFVIYGIK